MRKILLILYIFTFTFSFAQQSSSEGSIVNKNTPNTPVESIFSLAAYPNPLTVKSKINFTSTTSQEVVFSVKNILGKIMYSERLETKAGFNSIQFNRNNLPQGMYIYSIQTENEIVSKRLIIK